MHADAQGRDGSPLVGEPDGSHGDVSGEHGGHEAHPGDDDGEGLVVAEEDVVC